MLTLITWPYTYALPTYDQKKKKKQPNKLL